MPIQDRFGYPLTTASPQAAVDYTAALDLMLSANAGAETLLDRALAADPEFALGHIARARLCQVQARVPEARDAASRARALASHVTPREARHIETIALAVDGAGPQAMAMVEEHTAEYPRDAGVLSLALGVFGLLGFSGRSDHHKAQLDLLLTPCAPMARGLVVPDLSRLGPHRTGRRRGRGRRGREGAGAEPAQRLCRPCSRAWLLRSRRRGERRRVYCRLAAGLRRAQPASRPHLVASSAVRTGAGQSRPRRRALPRGGPPGRLARAAAVQPGRLGLVPVALATLWRTPCPRRPMGRNRRSRRAALPARRAAFR